MRLHELVWRTAQIRPERPAVVGPDAALTYADLDRAANRAAHALAALGVGSGDRVGVWLEKSAAAVAVMQGVLRLGAAYVPIDPMSPAARARRIIADCTMRAVVTTEPQAAAALTDELLGVPRLLLDRGLS